MVEYIEAHDRLYLKIICHCTMEVDKEFEDSEVINYDMNLRRF